MLCKKKKVSGENFNQCQVCSSENKYFFNHFSGEDMTCINVNCPLRWKDRLLFCHFIVILKHSRFVDNQSHKITKKKIPLALSTITTIVMCVPELITAELTSTTYLRKQADLYLQRLELDRDFAGGSVLFCASELSVPQHETKRVRTESVPV